jgi:hypothetical protein
MDYSFIRENFNINSISKSILSIQISLDGFSFVISPAENLANPDYIYINRLNSKSGNLINVLSSFTGFDSREFYSIRIIVHVSTFALVPETIFELKDMKAYLNLNHPHKINRKNLSNTISSAAAVSVFSIEEELYKLLKNKFPGADFCHSSLPLCTMALNMEIDVCTIQVYEKSMELAIVKNKKLVHYNIYELQGENDIIYFILNAYKSTELNQLNAPLIISGVLPKNSETLIFIKKYFKDVRFYSTDYVILSDTGEFQYPSHYFLNHREILNCEL